VFAAYVKTSWQSYSEISYIRLDASVNTVDKNTYLSRVTAIERVLGRIGHEFIYYEPEGDCLLKEDPELPIPSISTTVLVSWQSYGRE
jgi:hypothetical protein